MTKECLQSLLEDTEKAHAASGHSAKDWAEWYARYMLPKLQQAMESDNAKAWN